MTGAKTNPEEFRAFHELLTQDKPDFTPHYFRLRKGDKDPDVKGSWKKCRLTFKEAYDEMKRGFNIGIAGTDKDELVVVDLDRPGIEDVKPTLRVKSRKRQGWHNFYFTTDPKCKKNIPTEDSGEVRSSWQYVVACGSFVTLEPEKIAKLPKPERALAGAYTLEHRVPPVDLVFDELPALFRMQTHEQERPQAPPPDKKKVNFKSGIWKLTGRDIFNDAPPSHVRWASPFHESETGKNTSMSDQGLIHCWRHNVSLTAIQALAVMGGFASCMDAGHSHSGSGAGDSKLDLKDKELVRKVWGFAKEKGFLPQDDSDPYEIEKPGKDSKKKEEDKKYTALRIIGDVVYRQIKTSEGAAFARHDRTTGDITQVDHIKQTKEWPVVNEGVNFPRRLAPYGSAALLYKRLKERVEYASSQSGTKNAIFVLFLLYHGCIPPFARKNPQIFPMGPAGTGKGRYVDLARHLGDRARVTTDVRMATSYRLNAMLGGGLEILDEMPDEDLEVEAYVRSRYDPEAVQQRLLDPHSVSDIRGFRIAGPTIVTRRRGFQDDANTDRGIIINCERPEKPIPLELIDRAPDKELHDQLALFWNEYYGDERLLPDEGELMYDPSIDDSDPRLALAARYYMKLADIIGPDAKTDLEDFVGEQEKLRRAHKATTTEGMVLQALWTIISEHIDGRHYAIESKSGDTRKVCDTLTYETLGSKCIIYLSRTPDGVSADSETKLVPISWSMIGRRAGIGREKPNVLLAPHTVAIERAGGEHNRVRTVGFKIPNLDLAFKTFLPEYDPTWKKRLSNNGTGQVSLDFSPPAPPPPPSLMAKQEVPPVVEKIEQVEATQVVLPTASADLAAINGQLVKLQQTLCPHSYDHEVQIFKWAIGRLVDAKLEGDKLSAFHLRAEGRKVFSDWETDVLKIVDTAFVELELLAEQIFQVKRARPKNAG